MRKPSRADQDDGANDRRVKRLCLFGLLYCTRATERQPSVNWKALFALASVTPKVSNRFHQHYDRRTHGDSY